MASMTVNINVRPGFGADVDAACRRALEICGGKAETYAKLRCPVDTGNLQNSITHQPDGDRAVIIGTPVEYAPYVELGHHTTTGRFVAPRPYLLPALEEHVSEYEQVIKSELSKL